MHTMYKELNSNNAVSYEYYRQVLETNFNVSFGYPRCDTCSTCDKHQAEIKFLNLELENEKWTRITPKQSKNVLQQK